MKLHLPSRLRKALLACLAALTARRRVPHTVSTGTALLGVFSLLWPSAARASAQQPPDFPSNAEVLSTDTGVLSSDVSARGVASDPGVQLLSDGELSSPTRAQAGASPDEIGADISLSDDPTASSDADANSAAEISLAENDGIATIAEPITVFPDTTDWTAVVENTISEAGNYKMDTAAAVSGLTISSGVEGEIQLQINGIGEATANYALTSDLNGVGTLYLSGSGYFYEDGALFGAEHTTRSTIKTIYVKNAALYFSKWDNSASWSGWSDTLQMDTDFVIGASSVSTSFDFADNAALRSSLAVATTGSLTLLENAKIALQDGGSLSFGGALNGSGHTLTVQAYSQGGSLTLGAGGTVDSLNVGANATLHLGGELTVTAGGTINALDMQEGAALVLGQDLTVGSVTGSGTIKKVAGDGETPYLLLNAATGTTIAAPQIGSLQFENAGLGKTGEGTLKFTSEQIIGTDFKIAQGVVQIDGGNDGINFTFGRQVVGAGALLIANATAEDDKNGDGEGTHWVTMSGGAAMTGDLQLSLYGAKVALGADAEFGGLTTVGDDNRYDRGRTIKKATEGGDPVTLTVNVAGEAVKNFAYDLKVLEGVNLVKSGAGSQTINGLSLAGDLEVNGGTLSLTADSTVGGDLTVATGAHFKFNSKSGQTLTVNGQFHLGEGGDLLNVIGNLTIGSADVETNLHDTSVTGTVTVQARRNLILGDGVTIGKLARTGGSSDKSMHYRGSGNADLLFFSADNSENLDLFGLSTAGNVMTVTGGKGKMLTMAVGGKLTVKRSDAWQETADFENGKLTLEALSGNTNSNGSASTVNIERDAHLDVTGAATVGTLNGRGTLSIGGNFTVGQSLHLYAGSALSVGGNLILNQGGHATELRNATVTGTVNAAHQRNVILGENVSFGKLVRTGGNGSNIALAYQGSGASDLFSFSAAAATDTLTLFGLSTADNVMTVTAGSGKTLTMADAGHLVIDQATQWTEAEGFTNGLLTLEGLAGDVATAGISGTGTLKLTAASGSYAGGLTVANFTYAGSGTYSLTGLVDVANLAVQSGTLTFEGDFSSSSGNATSITVDNGATLVEGAERRCLRFPG